MGPGGKIILTTNMRSVLYADNDTGQFSTLLLKIGDRHKEMTTVDSSISIPQGCLQMVATLEELKKQVFLNILHSYSNATWF